MSWSTTSSSNNTIPLKAKAAMTTSTTKTTTMIPNNTNSNIHHHLRYYHHHHGKDEELQPMLTSNTTTRTTTTIQQQTWNLVIRHDHPTVIGIVPSSETTERRLAMVVTALARIRDNRNNNSNNDNNKSHNNNSNKSHNNSYKTNNRLIPLQQHEKTQDGIFNHGENETTTTSIKNDNPDKEEEEEDDDGVSNTKGIFSYNNNGKIRVLIITSSKSSAQEIRSLIQQQLNHGTKPSLEDRNENETIIDNKKNKNNNQDDCSSNRSRRNDDPISYCAVYGGRARSRDLSEMEQVCKQTTHGVPTIWIGTPGRLWNHLQYSSLLCQQHQQQQQKQQKDNNKNDQETPQEEEKEQPTIIMPLRDCVQDLDLLILDGLDELLALNTLDELQHIVACLSSRRNRRRRRSFQTLIYSVQPLSEEQVRSVLLHDKDNKNNNRDEDDDDDVVVVVDQQRRTTIQSSNDTSHPTRTNDDNDANNNYIWFETHTDEYQRNGGYITNNDDSATTSSTDTSGVVDENNMFQTTQQQEQEREQRPKADGGENREKFVAVATTTTTTETVRVLPRDKYLWGTVQILLHLMLQTNNHKQQKEQQQHDKILVIFPTQEQVSFFANLFNLHLGYRVLEWPDIAAVPSRSPDLQLRRRRAFVRDCFWSGNSSTMPIMSSSTRIALKSPPPPPPKILFISAREKERGFWCNRNQENDNHHHHHHSNVVTHMVQVGLWPNGNVVHSNESMYQDGVDHEPTEQQRMEGNSDTIPMERRPSISSSSIICTKLWILSDLEALLLDQYKDLICPDWTNLHDRTMEYPERQGGGGRHDNTIEGKDKFLLDPLVEEMQMHLQAQVRAATSSSSSSLGNSHSRRSSSSSSPIKDLKDVACAMYLRTLGDWLPLSSRVLTILQNDEAKNTSSRPPCKNSGNLNDHQRPQPKPEQQQQQKQQQPDVVLVDCVTETWLQPLGLWLSNPLSTLTRHEAKQYQLESLLLSAGTNATLTSPTLSPFVKKRQVWQTGRSFDVGSKHE